MSWFDTYVNCLFANELDFYYNVIRKNIKTRNTRSHYKEIIRKADDFRRVHGTD